MSDISSRVRSGASPSPRSQFKSKRSRPMDLKKAPPIDALQQASGYRSPKGVGLPERGGGRRRRCFGVRRQLAAPKLSEGGSASGDGALRSSHIFEHRAKAVSSLALPPYQSKKGG